MPRFLPALSPRHWPLLVLLAVLCTAQAAGHDGRRLLQMLVLLLPGWLWLGWPLASRGGRTLQAVLAGLLGLAFLLDGIVRAFLLDQYQAQPGSAMVLGAVANTSPGETAEFVAMYWRAVLGWSLAGVLGAGTLAACLWQWWRKPPRRLPLRWKQAVALGLILAVVLAAYASKPWRRHHPLLFWPGWLQQVAQLQQQWATLDGERQALLLQAERLQPELTAAAPDTLVLVITDSVNRDHFGLYGYPRATTPQLQAVQQRARPALQVFRHAWSVDASTVPALRNLFQFGTPDQPDAPHLLALARAAGYRVWWIGNHADLAIEQEHARLAQQVRMVNQSPGRSGGQPDGVVLPELAAALADPAHRKLVVIHLLGAHPHYRLRYPAGDNPFSGAADAVMASMQAAGRPGWLRGLRNDYDAAIHYHDRVLAGTLEHVLQARGKRVWLYLSDHGQEVGQESNHAGHSPMTASGYRIPLLLWQSHPGTQPAATGEPVRADWLGYSITALLGLAWSGARPERDVLSPGYHWQAPTLPVTVDFHR
ncbi:phosphoethanolamine transferase [Chitinilyticum aquatile]|uniref:phosphoethanolamine transferase n=1 Tax=Chitinilyticum aquatile TaxID=362520 RepID=UPI000409B480|nr:phosphoethanolamine transferase [Chitinilyticum aquatile]